MNLEMRDFFSFPLVASTSFHEACAFSFSLMMDIDDTDDRELMAGAEWGVQTLEGFDVVKD